MFAGMPSNRYDRWAARQSEHTRRIRLPLENSVAVPREVAAARDRDHAARAASTNLSVTLLGDPLPHPHYCESPSVAVSQPAAVVSGPHPCVNRAAGHLRYPAAGKNRAPAARHFGRRKARRG
jgi:hypothetical protein